MPEVGQPIEFLIGNCLADLPTVDLSVAFSTWRKHEALISG